MNLVQLRKAVYDSCGLSESDKLITPVVVTGFINRAIHSYSTEGTWPWLQASETIPTVAGQDTYVPGAVAFAISSKVVWLRTSELRVADNESNVIEWKSPTELDDKWNFLGSNGVPEDFTIYQDTIIFRPIPDGTVSIIHRFEQAEVDLVNETDTPVLPAEYHEVLINYAAYLCFRRSRETERMQEALNAYNVYVAKMRARALRRADLPGRVRVRPYGWL